MKIIQTYWSKPINDQNSKKDVFGRFAGGWLSEKHHYISWALSCLKLKQFYDDVELYTDTKGKEILIDKLKLPYSKVHVCLDHFDYLPSSLWAIPKMYTYSLQDEPFLHVDGDVYIWEPFPVLFSDAYLIAQHFEDNYHFYIDALDFVFAYAKQIPPSIKKFDWRTKGIQSVNAGILGGKDIGFIKEYCRQAFAFLRRNEGIIHNENASKINFVIEQYLFFRLAKSRKTEINFLLTSLSQDYSDLMQFHYIPYKQTFIHLVGSGKQNANACKMISFHLQSEFPSFYKRVSRYFDKKTMATDFVRNSSNRLTIFFARTIIVIEHFLPDYKKADIKTYRIISKCIEQISLLVTNKKLGKIISEIFAFENIQYQLNKEPISLSNEMAALKKFRDVKSFLSGQDTDVIMNQKFVLATNAKILTTNFNIPEITKEDKWINRLTKNSRLIKKDEHVFLFLQDPENNISCKELTDKYQLLYYFSFSPISCSEVLSLITEDEDQKPHLSQIIMDFLANVLTYEPYLNFSE